jgi:hypothetical protein
MSRALRILAVGVVLALTSLAPASARSVPKLVAMLGGERIPTTQVGRYHCHDFDYPIIRCFRTAARVERAVDAKLSGVSPAAGLNYVRVFEHVSYDGESMYISQNYPNLTSVGWNDRISSFKSVNLGSGMFREHSWYLGAGYGFCCNNWVSNVGGAYNDIFSSVSGAA